MQASFDNKAFDTVIHPRPVGVNFLEDLLQEMVDKKSKDPFWDNQSGQRSTSQYQAFSHHCTAISAEN